MKQILLVAAMLLPAILSAPEMVEPPRVATPVFQCKQQPDLSKYEAFIYNSRPRIEKYYVKDIVSSVYDASQQFCVPPELILATIRTESSFNQYAVSNVGAIGLMQVYPPVWYKHFRRLGILSCKEDLYDVRNNIWCGTYILKTYLDQTGWSIPKTMARYLGAYDKAYVSSVRRYYKASMEEEPMIRSRYVLKWGDYLFTSTNGAELNDAIGELNKFQDMGDVALTTKFIENIQKDNPSIEATRIEQVRNAIPGVTNTTQFTSFIASTDEEDLLER